MTDYFNCKLCDKSIKIKSKKKHLNSKYHDFWSTRIICPYIITNPHFLQIEGILKSFIHDNNKKFVFYINICKWKLHFSERIISVKNDKWCRLSADFYLREFLLSKNKFFERCGYKFSHICEMNITFLSHPKNMNYEHYLNQPKSMLKWKLNLLLNKNPELISIFENSFHPIIRKFRHINEDDDEN